MQPKQIWANLAVSDLDRTRDFYSALGFTSNDPRHAKDLTSFYFGDDKFVINFFLRDVLRKSMQGNLAGPESGNEIMFTLSADTREEVDQWAKEVEPAGGKVVSPPAAFGEGWYGFAFTDPDGHKFNVFYM